MGRVTMSRESLLEHKSWEYFRCVRDEWDDDTIADKLDGVVTAPGQFEVEGCEMDRTEMAERIGDDYREEHASKPTDADLASCWDNVTAIGAGLFWVDDGEDTESAAIDRAGLVRMLAIRAAYEVELAMLSVTDDEVKNAAVNVLGGVWEVIGDGMFVAK